MPPDRRKARVWRKVPPGCWVYKERPDYTVYCGGWDVGRIYTPAAVPTVCAGSGLTVTGPLTRSDRVATLEEAKAQFQKSWDAWKAWAKLEEVPGES